MTDAGTKRALYCNELKNGAGRNKETAMHGNRNHFGQLGRLAVCAMGRSGSTRVHGGEHGSNANTRVDVGQRIDQAVDSGAQLFNSPNGGAHYTLWGLVGHVAVAADTHRQQGQGESLLERGEMLKCDIQTVVRFTYRDSKRGLALLSTNGGNVQSLVVLLHNGSLVMPPRTRGGYPGFLGSILVAEHRGALAEVLDRAGWEVLGQRRCGARLLPGGAALKVVNERLNSPDGRVRPVSVDQLSRQMW